MIMCTFKYAQLEEVTEKKDKIGRVAAGPWGCFIPQTE